LVIIFKIAPPEVAGNSAPGCVIISFFQLHLPAFPLKALSSVVEILRGLPSIKHPTVFLGTSFQQYLRLLNLVIFYSFEN
jgi:hypothetical protein